MSATLHVASHEIPYVQECLRLGILAANARPFDDDDWDAETIEAKGLELICGLADASTSGEGYVEVPIPVHEAGKKFMIERKAWLEQEGD